MCIYIHIDTHIYKINTTIYIYAYICVYTHTHTHMFYLYKFEIWSLERPFQMRCLGDVGIIFVPWFVKPKGNDPPTETSAPYFIHIPEDGRLVLNMR